MKGKIERLYKNEFNAISIQVRYVWDNFKQQDSFKDYEDKNLSFTRFLFDSFYATKISIGDGIGTTGDFIIPDCKDSHIKTAVTSMWKQYTGE